MKVSMTSLQNSIESAIRQPRCLFSWKTGYSELKLSFHDLCTAKHNQLKQDFLLRVPLSVCNLQVTCTAQICGLHLTNQMYFVFCRYADI